MAKRGKHRHKGKHHGPAQPAAAPAASQQAADGAGASDDALDEEAPDHRFDGGAALAGEYEARSVSAGMADAAAPTGAARPIRLALRPRDRRSPFLVLSDYEQLSLSHVAGLPEQLDAPGLWRGVAYRIGSHRLASGFDEVVEILPMPGLTHVPGSLPWMLGVANVRGTLLPVVDLKQFLEGERTVLHEGQRVLVVRQPGGDVAVTIDELYGQRSFTEGQAIDAAAMAEGRYAHFIARAYRMNEQDWGVFSLDLLARTPEFRQAAA